MTMMRRRQSEKMKPHQVGARLGFSLLELLFVIAIIGLLIALLIPGLQTAMRQVNSTVCQHNLREIGQALHIYRLENDGWLPNVDIESQDHLSTWWAKLVPKPLSDFNVLACPEDPFKTRARRIMENQKDDADYASCSSYGLNNFLMRAGNGFLSNIDRHMPSRPGNTLLVADLGPDRLYGRIHVNDGGNDNGPPRNASMLQWDDGYDPYYDDEGYPWLTTRHGVGINVLTVDLSVVSIRTAELVGQTIKSYYPRCAAGGCSICMELNDVPHYSFASEKLYWYTGTLPMGDHSIRW